MTVHLAVLTISDGCFHGKRKDRSGEAITEWARANGFEVTLRAIVSDESTMIVSQLLAWADDGDAKIILTTGGTGLGPRDVTPEATRAVIEREAPGIAEALRSAGLKRTPRAVLSRGIAGTRANALIVNLPGSTNGVTEGLAVLRPLVEHIAALLRGETEH